MKNANILNDLNTLNKLHTSSVDSHTTNNGIVDFTCDNAGYVDNVVIEGETLVNLTLKQSPIWEDSGSNASAGNRIIMSDMNHNLVSPNTPYTFFNCSDKDILILGLVNHSLWSDSYTIPSNSSVYIQFNEGNYLGAIIGYEKDGWTSNDLGAFSKACVILEGDHTDKPVSYFEGLKSVGQGDKIDVLTTPIHNNLIPQNYTKGEGYWNSMINVGNVVSDSNWYRILEYIPVKPNTQYTGLYTGTQVVYYDENKNVIYHNQSDLVLGYEYYIFTTPQNAKYIRVSYPKDREDNICIFEGIKHDKKQISTTLRSLPNGVKDTIEKRGNKYVKVQRCGEVTLNGNETVTIHTTTDIPVFNISVDLGSSLIEIISDKYKTVLSSGKEEGILYDYSNKRFRISTNKFNAIETFVADLKSNPITIVYQLETPQIIELPNFNSQTYKGENTLIINSGVIQCDASFDVCEGIRSELDVIKDKVSSLDDYESGYEYSNEIVYLNGTYKPSWAENPYIVRIGKICILHCVLANDATKYGLPLVKLPSFALPKQHNRSSARGKCNDSHTLLLIDYDITVDSTVQVWTTHETTKLNELYINMMWEVE